MSMSRESLLREGLLARLRTSEVDTASLGRSVGEWLTMVGDRRFGLMLNTYHRNWAPTYQPPPDELCERTPLAFADVSVRTTPDMNPGLVQLQSSIAASNERPGGQCLFSSAPIAEAKLAAGTLREILSHGGGSGDA